MFLRIRSIGVDGRYVGGRFFWVDKRGVVLELMTGVGSGETGVGDEDFDFRLIG